MTTSKELPDYISSFYPDVYGLVLSGGQSTRMGKDKGSLQLEKGLTQTEKLYNLLREQLPKVFVSSRQGQYKGSRIANLPQIYDQFDNLGPYGGILSAMMHAPNAAWLVVACDLPLLDEGTIQYLLKHRNPLKLATCFKSSHDDLPEPLCAIWEPRSKDRILDSVEVKVFCPRKLLIAESPEILTPINREALDNCNTPKDLEGVVSKLQVRETL